ncbi:MAG: hypothetical protein JWQ90_3476 [Hydrocarboniphaga sp.]|uniref:hypothetical protein n=1 Tax=Hydrocarboniphaga sp. TaxID=2033016 RepID=UPI00261307FB|nr:hypothetical protein [Hydrocarboniphaga sp.]MDB5971026.1 hypothetical protein [Hydrocarboniphaga sp.]
MSQNIISLNFAPADMAEIDTLLTTLEQKLEPLISLEPDERRKLNKMGDKSEAFCRQTINLLAQNPQVVPPTLDVAEAQRDLADLDALRPRFMRLSKLMQKADDSEMALGSDLMCAAMDGYGLLKIAGKGQGLDGLVKEISVRFQRKRTPPATT